MKLKGVISMLNVSDIEASLDFYREALAFKVVSDPQAVKHWGWAVIRSGAAELMLSQTESGPGLRLCDDPQLTTEWPSIFYFYPDDVAALYARVTARGLSPTPLKNTIYGMREFSLRDPDGHMLSFGEDVPEAKR